jgi:serine/threonine protein phosphatase 1
MKQYAISDIHGCAKTFKALLKQISFSKEDVLYLLGDYVDRGPDSKGVIDHIWQLQSEGYTVFCLKGNHEQLMIDSLVNWEKRRSWLTYGGLETIESFAVQTLEEIPEVYIVWLKNLPHFLEIEGYLLVHAGLNFELKNPLEDETAMLWIRRWYGSIDKTWLDGRIIVHGHTPTKQLLIQNSLHNLEDIPAIDIDAGCVFDILGLGRLCALDLDSRALYFESNIDR